MFNDTYMNEINRKSYILSVVHTDGWLIGFNGISTSIGYLMPKPVYTYVRFVDT